MSANYKQKDGAHAPNGGLDLKQKNRKPTGAQIVAQAMGIKTDTLRSRLLYHHISTKGMSAPDIAAKLEGIGQTFTPAQVRKITGDTGGPKPPPVHTNPTAPTEARQNGGRSNLRLAIIALQRLERIVLPLMQPGRYGERELLELEALKLLQKIDDA